jgi:hypothetical protein
MSAAAFRKNILLKLIDTLLTQKKLKEFFQKNIAAL